MLLGNILNGNTSIMVQTASFGKVSGLPTQRSWVGHPATRFGITRSSARMLPTRAWNTIRLAALVDCVRYAFSFSFIAWYFLFLFMSLAELGVYSHPWVIYSCVCMHTYAGNPAIQPGA